MAKILQFPRKKDTILGMLDELSRYESPREAKELEASSFDDIIEANAEKKKRLAAERREHNAKVTSSYNLKG